MLIRARKLGQYIPEDIKEIASLLADKEFTCYVVGGAIRDVLRGKTVKDFDLATDALPEQIEEIFERTIPTGKAFGTITIRHNNKSYEITTFRKESDYADARHPDQIIYTRNIKEDVARRDFTINALAYNPINDELVDEFHGLEDIKNKIIRTVGDPEKRFAEDGLRVLRALRFLSHTGFAIEINTAKAMLTRLENWQGLASKERIFMELDKTINSDNPDYGLAFLNFPQINHIELQARWAAIIKEKPEIFELVLEKQKRRWINKLLKYDLNIEKASLEIADLRVDGINIMELGPRGEEVGHILETLLEVVIEKRGLNKKPILLELAKDIMSGMTAQDILEREAAKKAAARAPIV